MKMLTTQVSGLLDRIATNHEDAFEETARLLAQASVGEGRIVIATFGEFEVLDIVALAGEKAMKRAVKYHSEMNIDGADRVWILTPSVTHAEAVALAHRLAADFIPFAVVSSEKFDDQIFYTEAMTYITTGLVSGLLPGEDGERIVQPHGLAALFIYEAVKMMYDEMLHEWD